MEVTSPDRSMLASGRSVISARLGASFFAVGGLMSLGALVAPPADRAGATGYLILAAVQLAAAATLVTLPRALHWRSVPALVVAGGIGCVTASICLNGWRLTGPGTLSEFYFVWVAFYVGYFLKARGIAASVALIAVAYAGAMAYIGAPVGVGISRWLVVVSVVGGMTAALRYLRIRIDRLLAQLAESARTDALTRLLNRRGFEERFERELERWRRTRQPFALVLGDMDRFKDLNDTHGHAAGDAALGTVAEALARDRRTLDSAARIGGEEFALLLPSTDLAGAFKAAERARGHIESMTAAGAYPMTMSFGVAAYGAGEQTQDGLFAAADRALYAAKAAGRNRTVA